MKVAILHDYLNQNGGAERVLQAFLEIFPNADLYTLFCDARKFPLLKTKIKKSSFLDNFLVRHHHRLFIPLFPLASSSLRTEEKYDLVLSSSAGYAKSFNINGAIHLSYCHTPVRYALDPSFLPRTLQFIARPIIPLLKKWDKHTSKKVSFFIANSNFIKNKIKDFYEREAQVVHPPVDETNFFLEPSSRQEDFYLMVGRLVPYKKFDFGIRAFNQMGEKLKIVGSGPEYKKLKNLAGKNVELLPRLSDSELRHLYNKARALIFPQIEDFGLVAAEAQICGLPVIAYGEGGILDIVENETTGLLFKEQTVPGLISAVEQSRRIPFDRNLISKKGQRFSKKVFKDKIKGIIEQNVAGKIFP